MPIRIPSDLPACRVLEQENIFVMTERRAASQDIRPLKIAIVNLMPTKEVTETQLLRLLGNTPLQIDISLVRMEGHESKNTDNAYLDKFYIPSSELFTRKYDGMIIFTDGEGAAPKIDVSAAVLWILDSRLAYEKSRWWIESLSGNHATFLPLE